MTISLLTIMRLSLRKIGSITSAQKEIDSLKSSINELGPVNVQAIEEYRKTKERFEFMDEQKTIWNNREETAKSYLRDDIHNEKEIY